VNLRIQVMLDSRQREAHAAADTEVGGMWAKAVRTLRSSEVAGLDPDSAFTPAYQAALQASTTVIRARVTGCVAKATTTTPSPR
jgi:multidrug resistance efflux pump